MNKQGVYTPAQIEEHVIKAWKQFVTPQPESRGIDHITSEDTIVSRNDARVIVKDSVNSLGKMGNGC